MGAEKLPDYGSPTGSVTPSSELEERRTAMKIIALALVALSVLAGAAVAPASALDTKTFYDQQDRQAH